MSTLPPVWQAGPSRDVVTAQHCPGKSLHAAAHVRQHAFFSSSALLTAFHQQLMSDSAFHAFFMKMVCPTTGILNAAACNTSGPLYIRRLVQQPHLQSMPAGAGWLAGLHERHSGVSLSMSLAQSASKPPTTAYVPRHRAEKTGQKQRIVENGTGCRLTP